MTERIADARRLINRRIEDKKEQVKYVIEEIERCIKHSSKYMEEGNTRLALDYLDTIGRRAKDADELKAELESLYTQLQVLDFVEKDA